MALGLCHPEALTRSTARASVHAVKRRVHYNEAGRRIGESHPASTISDAVVRMLRHIADTEGLGARRLARRFGLSRSAVQKILAGTRRSQVPARVEIEEADDGES